MFVTFLAYVITIDDLLRTIRTATTTPEEKCCVSLAFLTTRIISGFERRTNDCPHFGLSRFFHPITVYTDVSRGSIGFNLTQVQHGKESHSERTFKKR